MFNANDKKVFEYIELLKNDNYGEIVDAGYNEQGIRLLPYARYNKTVLDYLEVFSNSSFVRYDYNITFERIVNEPIDSLNKEELCCLLTAHTRGDRFVEGYLLGRLKDGDVVKALKRLKELVEE